MMKVLFGVLLLVAASLAVELTAFKYHERIGIPKAAQLMTAEDKVYNGAARISGGAAAALNEFPYLAGLWITLVSSSTSVCGASMLSNTRLLTAAHCWWDGNDQARYFTVVLGSVMLQAGGTRVNTNSVEVHASYNPWNMNNDIAVVTIPWVSYTNNIKNIILPPTSLTYVANWAVASGYGVNNNGGGANNQVKSFVWSTVISNTVCSQRYGNSITASNICTSGDNAVGICDGDSGGPLAIESGNQMHLIGVSMYGSARSCQAGLPSVYIRTFSYLAWINARM